VMLTGNGLKTPEAAEDGAAGESIAPSYAAFERWLERSPGTGRSDVVDPHRDLRRGVPVPPAVPTGSGSGLR
jgi:hypothetical protein